MSERRALTAEDLPPGAGVPAPEAVRELLAKTGARQGGHFLLTSGRHSDSFFMLARLFEHPQAAQWAAAGLTAALRRDGPAAAHAPTVVGPAMGGVILAYEMARCLGGRALFAEKVEDGGMRLRRGFRVAPGEPVLVVEDALTTGGSVARALEAVRAQGGMPVAVATVVRRGRHVLPFDLPMVALLEEDVRDWSADACPLCAAGEDLVRPKG